MRGLVSVREVRMNVSWHKLVPIGEFPHPSGVTQVIDRPAVVSMAKSFDGSAKTLIDFDHYSDLSADDQTVLNGLGLQLPSEAAGWVTAVEPRADGLWGAIDWTPAGAAALLNKTYRFLSPVWLRSACETVAAGRLRPLSLAKLGLTNEPNIRAMPALANRADTDRLAGPDVLVNSAPADSGTTSPGAPGRKESNMDFKAELLALLGLPAEATDEQISAACAAKKTKDTEVQNRATAAEGKVVQFETAALVAQVETDLATHGAKIANRDQWKAALMANRAETIKLLEALPEPSQKLLNRRDAKQPTIPGAGADATTIANRRKEQDTKIDEAQREFRCPSRAQAYNIAAARNPELFA
jgi:phage I-like protein